MAVTLRDATDEDAAAIAAIWNPIIRETAATFWPDERSPTEIARKIARHQAQGHAFLVALNDGDLAGFAFCGQFRGGAGYARSTEHSIYVAPDAQGMGTGRALLCAIEGHARHGGARLSIGAITGDNGGSIRFHERMGYARWGLIPAAGWKFGRFHDLVLMGKDLQAQ